MACDAQSDVSEKDLDIVCSTGEEHLLTLRKSKKELLNLSQITIKWKLEIMTNLNSLELPKLPGDPRKCDELVGNRLF